MADVFDVGDGVELGEDGVGDGLAALVVVVDDVVDGGGVEEPLGRRLRAQRRGHARARDHRRRVHGELVLCSPIGRLVRHLVFRVRERANHRSATPANNEIHQRPAQRLVFFFCSCFFFLSLPIAISLPETKDERNAVSMRTDFLDFGQRNKESNKVHCRTRAIGPFHWTSQNKNKKQKTIEMDERLEFGKQMTNEKGVPRAQRAMNPWAWRRVASQRSLMST